MTMNRKILSKFLTAIILVGNVNFFSAIVNFDAKNLQIISVTYAEELNTENSTESNNVAVARKFVSGISLYDKKKYKEAAEIFEEIVDLAPTPAAQLQVCGYLGFCYNELKQFEKADKYLEMGLELEKTELSTDNKVRLLMYKGLLYANLSMENFEKVVDYGTKCIEKFPPVAKYSYKGMEEITASDEDIYVMRANAYMKLGMNEKALEDLDCAVTINPRDKRINLMRKAIKRILKVTNK